MPEALLLFALVAFIGIATPGPTVLLALTNGSKLGVRASVPGMFGAVVSDFILIAAVGVGLGALLAASEFWFSVVKSLGAAYLAYLGISLLRSTGTLALPEGQASRCTARTVFHRSLLVAVTNPKDYLFFSAFLPQFIVPNAPQWPQYAALAVTFASIDFAVMLTYAVAGAKAVNILRAKGAQWPERICGGALLALAVSLAVYRRQA